MGYPLGGSEDETKFFFLEMHFENPYGDLGVKDNSGMRIYGTKQYREIEMGIYSAGAFPDPMAMGLPPNIDRVNLEYLCTKNDINVNLFFYKFFRQNLKGFFFKAFAWFKSKCDIICPIAAYSFSRLIIIWIPLK